MSEKKIISGDDSAYMTDAFNQAKTEGLIDDEITINQFREMTKHEIINLEINDPEGKDYITEAARSSEQIARLFRDKRSRKKILKRWFDKSQQI